MRSKRLAPDYYKQDALTIAPDLLGKILCSRVEGEVRRFRITETEAYCGEDDKACHAHRGKTPRTSILYEEGGLAYVYLCYGIHNLLNVVCCPVGEPQAVLIRGLEGHIGPGRTTKALGVTREHNWADLIEGDLLWLEDDGTSFDYTTAPRVGIDYAEEYKDMPWRFIAKI